MTHSLLEESRGHLADLLEACQRCAWYLQASANKVHWPVTGRDLADRSKDVEFYERLAAINERFGKLQDLLTTTVVRLSAYVRQTLAIEAADSSFLRDL